jgi:hypothetical protein
MPLNKVPGKGTALQTGGVAGTTFTTITQRVSIEGPGREVGGANVTDLDSACVEERPTIPDNGDVTLKLWFDPEDTAHKALEAKIDAPVIEYWRIVFNNGTASRPGRKFQGWASGWQSSGMVVDGYIEAELKIRVTSNPTVETVTWP